MFRYFNYLLFSFLICVASAGLGAQVASQTSLNEAAEQKETSPSKSDGDSSQKTSEEGETSDISLDISEKLSIDEEINSLNQLYQSALDRWGISGNLVGTVLAGFAFLTLRWISGFLVNAAARLTLKQKRKLGLNRRRIDFYRDSVKFIVRLILFLITVLIILGIWEVDMSWLSADVIQQIISKLFAFLLVVFISIFAIELVSGMINHYFKTKDLSGSRIETVKPIAKNMVLGFLFFIFGMLALSQIGIDILPLLAGAGVLGIAIGFGAQALVKDILTGFIIILEDLIQVGDIITLNDKSGVVERITIRKVQLRNLDGTVYTIPFGEVSIVENHTKTFSYYLMDIGIAYREDVDEVRDILIQLGKELKEDDEYSDLILDELEILGLDQFADSAVIIKARIKTKPKQQWAVGREFNRRMKLRFDQLNIEIPFPHQTLYLGQDKDGQSPALNINLENKAGD